MKKSLSKATLSAAALFATLVVAVPTTATALSHRASAAPTVYPGPDDPTATAPVVVAPSLPFNVEIKNFGAACAFDVKLGGDVVTSGEADGNGDATVPVTAPAEEGFTTYNVIGKGPCTGYTAAFTITVGLPPTL